MGQLVSSDLLNLENFIQNLEDCFKNSWITFDSVRRLHQIELSDPITILELISNSNFTAEIGKKIISLSDLLQFLVYPILLSLFVAFYFIRNLLEKNLIRYKSSTQTAQLLT